MPKDVEEKSFDCEEFIEELISKNQQRYKNLNEPFDPLSLQRNFEKSIKELNERKKKIVQETESYEELTKSEQKIHGLKISELLKNNQAAVDHVKSLDEKINFVSTKVMHLGDQLEGVNKPRTRAVEAQVLMRHFSKFMDPNQPLDPLFQDPKKMEEASEIIHKLYLITLELPKNEKFNIAYNKILEKYNLLEEGLLGEFREGYKNGDINKLKNIVSILINFNNYSSCVKIFIEESKKSISIEGGIFQMMMKVCEEAEGISRQIFPLHFNVMNSLVQSIMTDKLKKYIDNELRDKQNLEKYLQTLFILYQKTNEFIDLIKIKNLVDDSFLSKKIINEIFYIYLNNYINDEKNNLKINLDNKLNLFYQSKNHQKKNISGLNELRRDLQSAISTKTSILNIAPSPGNYNGETFISNHVTEFIIDEFKKAFKRTHYLSRDINSSSGELLLLLYDYFINQYIIYAIDLAISAIPVSEIKSEPNHYFFLVVNNVNNSINVYNKLFHYDIFPLLSGSTIINEIINKKKEYIILIENKLDLGIDRSLTSMINNMKLILNNEQKKSYFLTDQPSPNASNTCIKIINLLKKWFSQIKKSIDGKNQLIISSEFLFRFHRMLFEHVIQFQYSSIGAVLLIIDVNEYKKAMNELTSNQTLKDLMDLLHSLCNLTLVQPSNIKQVSNDTELNKLDKSVLDTFIQLRTDSKLFKNNF